MSSLPNSVRKTSTSSQETTGQGSQPSASAIALTEKAGVFPVVSPVSPQLSRKQRQRLKRKEKRERERQYQGLLKSNPTGGVDGCTAIDMSKLSEDESAKLSEALILQMLQKAERQLLTAGLTVKAGRVNELMKEAFGEGKKDE
jgi:hypothetical protein